ncbi:MAG: putative propionyl-CoA carboxylase beta chain 5 [Acidimicrobiales bacterium]|nr:MAG: methylmalonyl-CoA carboxyltransferase [Actinomycetota bacterium]MBV6509930.1 putative propionyl-CoA carboxylase beta chain 5 [Acidimicrobiales bacterium]RIK08579.1 MAG: methylmalonyl-CoA carboxyltransferase [Acidobacteriota bacterium]
MVVAELPRRAKTKGSVSARTTELGGRPAMLVEFDTRRRRGAIRQRDGDTLADAARAALAAEIPLVIAIASSGADVNEGVAALHGWGSAAREFVRCSGTVPIVAIVCGPALSGPALLLGLSDVVVMTDTAYAFVSGPQMIRDYTGVEIAKEALGGAGPATASNGCASLVVGDREEALDAVGDLLALLPSHVDQEPPRWDTADPPHRSCPGLEEIIPTAATGSYDIRDVLERVVDDGYLLELKPNWATNLVTALATVDGHPVGLVANQPTSIAGTLDIKSSQKGAGFVSLCDAFNLPLITFIDTPGFYPGKDLEWRGMIRQGAQLAFAYARATVPRVAVTLRKSYGGAYIVMDSKHMGNDVMLAWPTAEIAVMGARGAIEILHRGATPEERTALESSYEERLLNPYVAAARGSVDRVIEPSDTRSEIAEALAMLATKRERLRPRRHDNSPL